MVVGSDFRGAGPGGGAHIIHFAVLLTIFLEIHGGVGVGRAFRTRPFRRTRTRTEVRNADTTRT
jgi:hypothetical protein